MFLVLIALLCIGSLLAGENNYSCPLDNGVEELQVLLPFNAEPCPCKDLQVQCDSMEIFCRNGADNTPFLVEAHEDGDFVPGKRGAFYYACDCALLCAALDNEGNNGGGDNNGSGDNNGGGDDNDNKEPEDDAEPEDYHESEDNHESEDDHGKDDDNGKGNDKCNKNDDDCEGEFEYVISCGRNLTIPIDLKESNETLIWVCVWNEESQEYDLQSSNDVSTSLGNMPESSNANGTFDCWCNFTAYEIVVIKKGVEGVVLGSGDVIPNLAGEAMSHTQFFVQGEEDGYVDFVYTAEFGGYFALYLTYVNPPHNGEGPELLQDGGYSEDNQNIVAATDGDSSHQRISAKTQEGTYQLTIEAKSNYMHANLECETGEWPVGEEIVVDGSFQTRIQTISGSNIFNVRAAKPDKDLLIQTSEGSGNIDIYLRIGDTINKLSEADAWSNSHDNFERIVYPLGAVRDVIFLYLESKSADPAVDVLLEMHITDPHPEPASGAERISTSASRTFEIDRFEHHYFVVELPLFKSALTIKAERSGDGDGESEVLASFSDAPINYPWGDYDFDSIINNEIIIDPVDLLNKETLYITVVGVEGFRHNVTLDIISHEQRNYEIESKFPDGEEDDEADVGLKEISLFLNQLKFESDTGHVRITDGDGNQRQQIAWSDLVRDKNGLFIPLLESTLHKTDTVFNVKVQLNESGGVLDIPIWSFTTKSSLGQHHRQHSDSNCRICVPLNTAFQSPVGNELTIFEGSFVEDLSTALGMAPSRINFESIGQCSFKGNADWDSDDGYDNHDQDSITKSTATEEEPLYITLVFLPDFYDDTEKSPFQLGVDLRTQMSDQSTTIFSLPGTKSISPHPEDVEVRVEYGMDAAVQLEILGAVIAVLLFLLILSILLYFVKRRIPLGRASDVCCVILTAFDVASDIAFTTYLAPFHHFFSAAILTFIAVVFVNCVCIWRLKSDSTFMGWYEGQKRVFFAVALLSAFNIDVMAVLSSRLNASLRCNMTTNMQNVVQWAWLSSFLLDVPHLAIQLTASTDPLMVGWGAVSVLAIASSALLLAFSVIRRFCSFLPEDARPEVGEGGYGSNPPSAPQHREIDIAMIGPRQPTSSVWSDNSTGTLASGHSTSNLIPNNRHPPGVMQYSSNRIRSHSSPFQNPVNRPSDSSHYANRASDPSQYLNRSSDPSRYTNRPSDSSPRSDHGGDFYFRGSDSNSSYFVQMKPERPAVHMKNAPSYTTEYLDSLYNEVMESHRQYATQTDVEFERTDVGFESKKEEDCNAKTHDVKPLKKRPDKIYECPFCGKRFGYKGNMVVHTRTHTGEKRFQCDHCLKRFSKRQNLQSHIRSHTGEQPYICNICHKAFARQNNLTRHKLIHSDIKPFECADCQKRFISKSNLKSHIKIHGERILHHCIYCRKSFKSSNYFKKHIKKHEEGGDQAVYQGSIASKLVSDEDAIPIKPGRSIKLESAAVEAQIVSFSDGNTTPQPHYNFPITGNPGSPIMDSPPRSPSDPAVFSTYEEACRAIEGLVKKTLAKPNLLGTLDQYMVPFSGYHMEKKSPDPSSFADTTSSDSDEPLSDPRSDPQANPRGSTPPPPEFHRSSTPESHDPSTPETDYNTPPSPEHHQHQCCNTSENNSPRHRLEERIPRPRIETCDPHYTGFTFGNRGIVRVKGGSDAHQSNDSRGSYSSMSISASSHPSLSFSSTPHTPLEGTSCATPLGGRGSPRTGSPHAGTPRAGSPHSGSPRALSRPGSPRATSSPRFPRNHHSNSSRPSSYSSSRVQKPASLSQSYSSSYFSSSSRSLDDDADHVMAGDTPSQRRRVKKEHTSPPGTPVLSSFNQLSVDTDMRPLQLKTEHTDPFPQYSFSGHSIPVDANNFYEIARQMSAPPYGAPGFMMSQTPFMFPKYEGPDPNALLELQRMTQRVEAFMPTTQIGGLDLSGLQR